MLAMQWACNAKYAVVVESSTVVEVVCNDDTRLCEECDEMTQNGEIQCGLTV